MESEITRNEDVEYKLTVKEAGANVEQKDGM